MDFGSYFGNKRPLLNLDVSPDDMSFLFGFLSSLAASVVFAFVIKYGWPSFQDRALYRGIRVEGTWNIIEQRDGKNRKVGSISLKQRGHRITGSSVRKKRRDGKRSNRKFNYKGRIQGSQVTLLFEDERGVGFDSGAYVFIVQNDGITMFGMTTFHGKPENKVVSEPRTLKKETT